MNYTNFGFFLKDNGGRRSGIERRIFYYDDHIPERRIGLERRGKDDRRKNGGRRSIEDRRIGRLHLSEHRERRKNGNRRSGFDRRFFMVL